MTKLKKMHIVSILALILLWQIASIHIDNDIILPSLSNVLHSLKVILFTKKSYSIILTTIFRVIYAVGLTFLLTLILAYFSNQKQWFKELMVPIVTILKAVPNISIIIIVLIWLGSVKTVTIIPALIIFPIFYDAFIVGFESIDSNLMEISQIYSSNYFKNYFTIYLPLMKEHIIVSFHNALSLGMKVTVMAEVITQVQIGIGRRIYLEKVNLEMSNVMAWTLIIILILALFEQLLFILFKERKDV